MGSNAIAAGWNRTSSHLSAFTICLTTLLLFWPALKADVTLALGDDRYLQIVLAPLMCLFLLFLTGGEILSQARYSPGLGIPLLSLAILMGIACMYVQAGPALTNFAIVLTWTSGFIFCYGVRSFLAGFYPVCCLFLMIPLPAAWMDGITAALQHGSAAVSYEMLRLFGIPVLRHGMIFSIPGLNFEVAPECSGIRSSLALLVIAIVAGYAYLRSGWAR